MEKSYPARLGSDWPTTPERPGPFSGFSPDGTTSQPSGIRESRAWGAAESPSSEASATTKLHVDKAVDALVEEFGDRQPRETIERLMDDSVRQLTGSAQVEDFVPTLAHRFTRERLKALARGHAPPDAEPDVLFVGLEDVASAAETGFKPSRAPRTAVGRP